MIMISIIILMSYFMSFLISYKMLHITTLIELKRKNEEFKEKDRTDIIEISFIPFFNLFISLAILIIVLEESKIFKKISTKAVIPFVKIIEKIPPN